MGGRARGSKMGKRDDLIELYAEELRTKCGVEPEMDLLDRVTTGCGPLIYDAKTAVVDPSDTDEIARIRENFLVRKLGLIDGPELVDAIDAMISIYGADARTRHRAVVYYLLVKHFRKEAQFP